MSAPDFAAKANVRAFAASKGTVGAKAGAVDAGCAAVSDAAGVLEDASAEALEIEGLLISRAYLYLLFHKLLGAAPDAEVVDILLDAMTADVVDEYADDDETMRGLGRFLASLAAQEDRAALLDAARDEYTRLFVGPGALPAPSWESPYLTRELTLFQENTLAVREAYRGHGLQPKRIQRVPDDHAALLCAYMAQRADGSLGMFRAGDAAALAAELRDQRAFVVGHLNTWLAAFAKDLRASKTSVLYPQLVEALAAFCSVDATFLAEAAFWAEGRAEGEGAGIAAASADSPEAAVFATAEKARASLAAARPFGIEDYELESVA